MNKQAILSAIAEAKKSAKPRKFEQRIDFSISLKGVNLNKPEERIDEVITLPHPTGKKVKVCAFVGKELEVSAKSACDFFIVKDDFQKYDKKAIKKLVRQYDYFIAQANLMAAVAAAFGKVLGTRGKMPDPKMGCVIPPNADLNAVVKKLQAAVKIEAKKQPVVNCMVGSEKMSEDEVADNILAIYDTVKKKLPQGEHQIRASYLKLTMGPSIKIAEEKREKETANRGRA